MMSLTRLIVATVAGLAFGSVPVLAAHHNRVVPNAKLRMQRARIIALEAYPGGRIMKEELEHEGGGSGLRYSFDMKRGKSGGRSASMPSPERFWRTRPKAQNPKD